MPNNKSTAKRVRTSEKRRVSNLAVRSRLRKTIKSVRGATSLKETGSALRTAVSELDRAAKKGIIKKGAANRGKSRLARYLNKLPA